MQDKHRKIFNKINQNLFMDGNTPVDSVISIQNYPASSIGSAVSSTGANNKGFDNSAADIPDILKTKPIGGVYSRYYKQII